MPTFTNPDSDSQTEETPLREAWSDAARAAAAAGRKGKGSTNLRKENARTAFLKAGGKPKGLKPFRQAGMFKTYYRDKRGREFALDSRTNSWSANRIRAKQGKGSRKAANARKASRSVLRPWD